MIFLADGRLVLVEQVVDDDMRRFVAPDEADREAGGILLGHYRGPHIEIVKCTTPLPLDVRSTYQFKRSDPQHQQIATKEWASSGGTVNYVGEWHTHPEDYPSPSFSDKVGWWRRSLSRRPNSLAFIIVGNCATYCGMSNGTRLTVLRRID